MRVLLAFALVVPLALAASGQEGKKAQPDSAKLQGKWKIVYFEADGKKEDETTGHVFLFQGDTLNTPDGQMRFQLDPGKKPKQIDAKGKPRQGFPPIGMVGIYKLEGDKLTLCYSPLRKDARRPTEFKTAEGHRGALVVLQRVKANGQVEHER